jgi:hypothetical protein
LRGWVAASADFSKLIAMVEDHTVVSGHPSSTKSGPDLYEYSGGGVRQVNVLAGGATIGVCGTAAGKALLAGLTAGAARRLVGELRLSHYGPATGRPQGVSAG